MFACSLTDGKMQSADMHNNNNARLMASLQSVARPTAATIALCKHPIINNGGGG